MVRRYSVLIAITLVCLSAGNMGSYIVLATGSTIPLAALLSMKNSIIDTFYPQPTAQQHLLNFANKVSKVTSFEYSDAEAINDMKLVGMKEMRAVTAFTIKRSMLPEKMRIELISKKMPTDVIDAITKGIAGVSKYTNSLEDFLVGSDGNGKIFKATVMMKPDPGDDEGAEVAMAISGAEFNAATELSSYEEEEVPDYKEVEEIQTVIRTGILGDYKEPKTIKKMQFMGMKKKRTPIFKQKTFTKAKLESIKKFLEGKTLGEVKLLYGSSHEEP